LQKYRQDVEKDPACRLLKNAQIKGARNPEEACQPPAGQRRRWAFFSNLPSRRAEDDQPQT
jgi:hypothetical protein